MAPSVVSAPPNNASTSSVSLDALLAQTDAFTPRHNAPDSTERAAMLATLGYASLEALVDAAVPPAIRLTAPLALPAALGECAALAELREIASLNKVYRNFIGTGYYDTLTPPVIQRAIFENPGWYTCLLYTSPSPRDRQKSRMPSSA